VQTAFDHPVVQPVMQCVLAPVSCACVRRMVIGTVGVSYGNPKV